MKYCVYCGTSLMDDDVYCSCCGKKQKNRSVHLNTPARKDAKRTTHFFTDKTVLDIKTLKKIIAAICIIVIVVSGCVIVKNTLFVQSQEKTTYDSSVRGI